MSNAGFHFVLPLTLALSAVCAVTAASGASSAAVDAASGQKIFQRSCVACHSLTPGKKMTGPSLAGVYGRPVGKAPGYSYSPVLAKAAGVWDARRLDIWLSDPRAAYRGTKMVTRVSSASDRAALIAYLKTKPVK